MVPRAGFSGTWPLPHQSSITDAEPKSYREFSLFYECLLLSSECIISDQNILYLGFDSKGFTGWIDVNSFEPSEISVKTIDHTIIVECKHESRSDNHGPVERHFVRKFQLPFEYNMSLVTSTLSKDGILQLEAPKLEVRKVEMILNFI